MRAEAVIKMAKLWNLEVNNNDKNSLGRMILKPFIPYDKPDSLIQKNPRFMKEVYTTNTNKLVKSLSEVLTR